MVILTAEILIVIDWILPLGEKDVKKMPLSFMKWNNDKSILKKWKGLQC